MPTTGKPPEDIPPFKPEKPAWLNQPDNSTGPTFPPPLEKKSDETPHFLRTDDEPKYPSIEKIGDVREDFEITKSAPVPGWVKPSVDDPDALPNVVPAFDPASVPNTSPMPPQGDYRNEVSGDADWATEED
jgi:hypothetical protein